MPSSSPLKLTEFADVGLLQWLLCAPLAVSVSPSAPVFDQVGFCFSFFCFFFDFVAGKQGRPDTRVWCVAQ
jgi:hypothetical protein